MSNRWKDKATTPRLIFEAYPDRLAQTIRKSFNAPVVLSCSLKASNRASMSPTMGGGTVACRRDHHPTQVMTVLKREVGVERGSCAVRIGKRVHFLLALRFSNGFLSCLAHGAGHL